MPTGLSSPDVFHFPSGLPVSAVPFSAFTMKDGSCEGEGGGI